MFGPRWRSFLLLCPAITASLYAGSNPRIDWHTALTWLPENTHTLFVASKPFRILPPWTDEGNPGRDGSPAQALQDLTLGRLDEFPDLYAQVVNQPVEFALTGIQEWLPSSGIGIGQHLSCSVVKFATPVRAAFAASGHFNAEVIRSGSLRNKPEKLHLFGVRLTPSVLAFCQDSDSLKILVDRSRKPPTTRAMPGSLPEWRYVNAKAPAFVIRHYGPASHPTSGPGIGDELGPDDPACEGVVYNAQPIGLRQELFYLSGNPRTPELARQTLENREESVGPPSIRRLRNGAFRVRVNLISREGTGMFHLELLALLGFHIGI